MNNLVIGVDIAKRVFQLHWVEESGEIKSVQFGEVLASVKTATSSRSNLSGPVVYNPTVAVTVQGTVGGPAYAPRVALLLPATGK